MISDVLSVVIVGLIVILVIYPASHLVRQSWAARQRRLQLDDQAPKRPT